MYVYIHTYVQDIQCFRFFPVSAFLSVCMYVHIRKFVKCISEKIGAVIARNGHAHLHVWKAAHTCIIVYAYLWNAYVCM